MALLVVRVKPGSRRPGLSVDGDAVDVRVAAPARDGLANEAVRAALARALGLPKAAVTLARGSASREKAFDVRGLARDEALERLRATAADRNAASGRPSSR